MRKALAITVPTRSTDQVLRYLRRRKLVDYNFELGRTSDSVIIPLVRRLSEAELALLTDSCSSCSIIQEAFFKEARRRTRDLREAVDQCVPGGLMQYVPHSYDVIGDVAVLELPMQLDQFSSYIGKVVQNTDKRVRLVVRKSSGIQGQFRTRSFDVIAGEGLTETTYRESSCLFRLDVSSVYFNPRLAHERMRVAQQVKAGECVVDMFAGVGPYSVIIAKIQPKTQVYALDINPDAIRYLKENAFLNTVADRVIPVLGDAREVTLRHLRGIADRVIMNLPSLGRGFLDAAILALKEQGGIIHYYAFSPRNEELSLVEESLRSAIAAVGGRVHRTMFLKPIKEVAPNILEVAADVFVTRR